MHRVVRYALATAALSLGSVAALRLLCDPRKTRSPSGDGVVVPGISTRR